MTCYRIVIVNNISSNKEPTQWPMCLHKKDFETFNVLIRFSFFLKFITNSIFIVVIYQIHFTQSIFLFYLYLVMMCRSILYGKVNRNSNKISLVWRYTELLNLLVNYLWQIGVLLVHSLCFAYQTYASVGYCIFMLYMESSFIWIQSGQDKIFLFYLSIVNDFH